MFRLGRRLGRQRRVWAPLVGVSGSLGALGVGYWWWNQGGREWLAIGGGVRTLREIFGGEEALLRVYLGMLEDIHEVERSGREVELDSLEGGLWRLLGRFSGNLPPDVGQRVLCVAAHVLEHGSEERKRRLVDDASVSCWVQLASAARRGRNLFGNALVGYLSGEGALKGRPVGEVGVIVRACGDMSGVNARGMSLLCSKWLMEEKEEYFEGMGGASEKEEYFEGLGKKLVGLVTQSGGASETTLVRRSVAKVLPKLVLGAQEAHTVIPVLTDWARDDVRLGAKDGDEYVIAKALASMLDLMKGVSVRQRIVRSIIETSKSTNTMNRPLQALANGILLPQPILQSLKDALLSRAEQEHGKQADPLFRAASNIDPLESGTRWMEHIVHLEAPP